MPKTKHHVIYVPGISDDYLRVQGILVQFWRILGVKPHLHTMPWAGNEAFEPKLGRLISLIDMLSQGDDSVSLVGASAGAGAILHAYVQRKDKISGLAYICGKINRPESVSERTYAENATFKESLYSLPTTLAQLTSEDKGNMLSLYSSADTSVPHADTLIEGVIEKHLPPMRHGSAIVYAISLGASGLISFLKQTAKQM